MRAMLFLFLCFCLSLSLTHSLINSSHIHSLMLLLPCSLPLAVYSIQNGIWHICKDWTSIKCATASKCQCHCRLGSSHLLMTMPDGGALELWKDNGSENFGTRAHTKSYSTTWLCWWIDQQVKGNKCVNKVVHISALRKVKHSAFCSYDSSRDYHQLKLVVITCYTCCFDKGKIKVCCIFVAGGLDETTAVT